MSETPEISVIMPCFNVEGYVKRAVNSVLNQTLSNLELIAIDDGSTDNTYKELLSISDERLKIIRLPYNRGISAALNLGLKQGRGKYVAPIAGDDRWLSNKLQLQKKFLIENDIDAVISWTAEETEEDHLSTKVLINKFEIKNNALKFFLTSPEVGIGSTIFGKYDSVKEQLDEELQTNEDWEYFARLSILGIKFGVIREALTICTRRPDGLSKLKSNAQQALLAIGKFKYRASDEVLAQSYIRSALWMLPPENPKLFDAFALTKKAIQTDWKIIFSKNFLTLMRFFISFYFSGNRSTE